MNLEDKIYKDRLKKIKELYQSSKDWREVFFTEVYIDEDISQEAFIDYVEEICKTEIKDIKHLSKLTEITEEELGELEGDSILINARYSKYKRFLQETIRGGGTYKDLLNIKPKDFKLPNKFNGSLSDDQYSTILYAISNEYWLIDLKGLMLLPSLRDVAKKIEAPYSVVMDAYKLTKF